MSGRWANMDLRLPTAADSTAVNVRYGSLADVNHCVGECPLVARSGHSKGTRPILGGVCLDDEKPGRMGNAGSTDTAGCYRLFVMAWILRPGPRHSTGQSRLFELGSGAQ